MNTPFSHLLVLRATVGKGCRSYKWVSWQVLPTSCLVTVAGMWCKSTATDIATPEAAAGKTWMGNWSSARRRRAWLAPSMERVSFIQRRQRSTTTVRPDPVRWYTRPLTLLLLASNIICMPFRLLTVLLNVFLRHFYRPVLFGINISRLKWEERENSSSAPKE